MDKIFVSQNLQETVPNIKILNAFLSDHSPALCSIVKNYQNIKSKKDYGSLINEKKIIENKWNVLKLKYFICKPFLSKYHI